MLLISFHGTVANLYAYDANGHLLNPQTPDVLNACKGYPFDELRGIYAANGYLYVLNGGKDTSNILTFALAPSLPYNCTGSPFILSGGPIDHPFAMAFDGAGHAFVSNQDTNVVAVLNVTSKTTGTLASTSSYLQAIYPQGVFLSGTFIASSVSPLPNVAATTPVPLELGGLGVSEIDVSDKKKKKKEKVQNSVRDVAYYAGNSGLLFVVDEPTGIVRVYNAASGQPLLNSSPMSSPTHLLINGETIYVTAKNQVMTAPIPNPYTASMPSWVFTPLLTIDSGDSASGMAFDGAGNFYVAGRTSRKVFVFDSTKNFAPVATWKKLPDDPEFLLYVAD
jgi:hypothetical protein